MFRLTMLLSFFLSTAWLCAQERPHPRLDRERDPPGCWRTVKLTPTSAAITLRVIGYSVPEQDKPYGPNAVLGPARLDFRRLEGAGAENEPNPIYVATPALALVTLQLRYFDGNTPLGSILVAGEFAANEDGDAHAGEVRREVQRRLDDGTLWTVSNTSLLVQRYLGDSVTVLGEQAPLPATVSATRVGYVAYVPDPIALHGAKLRTQIEAAIAAAAIQTEFPTATKEQVEKIILREISVAPRWKESLWGVVDKAP